jgi:O-antigen/teichoic acid export membrane protein
MTSDDPASRSRFSGNSVALALNFGAVTLLALVQVRLLTAWLEPDAYGRFNALRGYSLLLSTVMLLGAPQLVLRFVPSLVARRRRGYALLLFAGTSVLTAGIGLLLMAAWVNGRLFLARVGVAGETAPELARWVTLSILFLSLRMIQNAFLMGLRSMGSQAAVEVLHMTALVTGIYLGRDHLDLLFLFRLLTGVSAGSFLLGLAAMLRALAREPEGEAAPGEGRSFFARYWAGAFLLSVVALAFTDLDRYLLALFVALEAVALFHVAGRILELARRFLSIPSLAIHPEITRLDATGRAGEVREILSIYLRANVLLGVVASLAIALTGKLLLRLLAGERYVGGYPVLLVLCLALPLSSFVAPLTTAMKALRQVGSAVACDVAWMGAYLGSFAPLVAWRGVEGIGWAQVGGALLQSVAAAVLARRRRMLDLPWSALSRILLLGLGAGLLVPVAGVVDAAGLSGLTPVLVAVAAIGVRAVLPRTGVFSARERDRLAGLVSPGWRRRLVHLALGPGSSAGGGS